MIANDSQVSIFHNRKYLKAIILSKKKVFFSQNGIMKKKRELKLIVGSHGLHPFSPFFFLLVE